MVWKFLSSISMDIDLNGEIMVKTSAVYERFFERIFKVFEVEMVRFARMTQGTIIKRGRLYTTPTREVQSLTKIEYIIDYESYGIAFTLIPQLHKEKEPCCIVKMDYVIDPSNKAIKVSLDTVLESNDVTPFIFQDILSEELMLEVIETDMATLRKNSTHFKEMAQNEASSGIITKKVLDEVHQLMGQCETLDETVTQSLLEKKLKYAISAEYKNFILGNSQNPCLLPPLIEKNYRYVSEESYKLRKKEALLSYAFAYLLTFLPMAILTYFVMGFTFWAVAFDSYYTTPVNTLLSIPSLVIGNFFVATNARSLARSLLYPKDQAIAHGVEMKTKHDKANQHLRIISILTLIVVLSVASWGGSYVLIFNQRQFSLVPNFMWIPPLSARSYEEVDHLEYRFNNTDTDKNSSIYNHYVMVFKDGQEVLLKPYLSITECEDILVSFLERKGIRTIK